MQVSCSGSEMRASRLGVKMRVGDEHESRVEKRGAQPHVHCLQNRLQLQNLQLIVDERNAFIDVQHSG